MKGIVLAGGSGSLGSGMGWLDSGTQIIGKQLGLLAKRLLKDKYGEYLIYLWECR
jgi:hypothetical protein